MQSAGKDNMWDIDSGDLIQIECGSNVIKKYTPADTRDLFDILFGADAPEEGKLFIENAAFLRQKLEQQSIYMPSVKFRDSNELSPDQFRIYIGIENFLGNITEYDLYEALQCLILKNQIEVSSPEKVAEIFQDSVKAFQGRRFEKAVKGFVKTYYWSTILDCKEELVNATINCGGIALINNNIDSALLTARRACKLAEEPEFCNPYLKYHAHNFLANMYWLSNNRELAIDNYFRAMKDVQYLNDLYLYVFAIWNAANTCMWTGNYPECIDLLDAIFKLILRDDNYPRETIETLYLYRAAASDQRISELQKQNEELMEINRKLSSSFLISIKEDVTNIIKKYGPMAMSNFFGVLTGKSSRTELNINSKNETTYFLNK